MLCLSRVNTCFESHCPRLATMHTVTVDIMSIHIRSCYLNPAYKVFECSLRNSADKIEDLGWAIGGSRSLLLFDGSLRYHAISCNMQAHKERRLSHSQDASSSKPSSFNQLKFNPVVHQ